MIPDDDEEERRRAGHETRRDRVSEAGMCKARDARRVKMNRGAGSAGEEVSDGARTAEVRGLPAEALGQACATIPREMARDGAQSFARFPSSDMVLPPPAGQSAKRHIPDTLLPSVWVSPAEVNNSHAIGDEGMIIASTGAAYYKQAKGMVGPHDRRQLPPWPEDRPLPARNAPGEGGRLIGGLPSAREPLDTAMAKAVARLFLSKLQVSVEVGFTGSHRCRPPLAGVTGLPRTSGLCSQDNRNPRRSATR